MATHAIGPNGFWHLEATLHNELNRYARLLLKANRDNLQGNELEVLFVTGLRMRKHARELDLTARQLEVMVEKIVSFLSGATQAPRPDKWPTRHQFQTE